MINTADETEIACPLSSEEAAGVQSMPYALAYAFDSFLLCCLIDASLLSY